jgi:hypothetical protein
VWPLPKERLDWAHGGSHLRRILRALNQLALFCASPVAHVIFERGQHSTASVVSLARYGFDAPEREPYMPSDWMFVRLALRGYLITNEDVLVDFGSGMGRVLCQVACHYPFGRVVGVELVPEFNRIAEHNLARVKYKIRAKAVELVTANVLDYEIPTDLSYAYFFNPFTGETFCRVIERIVDSIDANPRRVRLIYGNPKMDSYILRTGRFRLIRQSRGIQWRLKIAVYESIS